MRYRPTSCPSLFREYPNLRSFKIFCNCPLFDFSISHDNKLYLPASQNFIQYSDEDKTESCSTHAVGPNCIEIDLPELRKYAKVEEFAIPTMCGNINITITEDYQLIAPCFVGVSFDENDASKCNFVNVNKGFYPQDCNIEMKLSDHLLSQIANRLE